MHGLHVQVACGSGLERIYKFLQTDKAYNRCGVNMIDDKVRSFVQVVHPPGMLTLAQAGTRHTA